MAVASTFSGLGYGDESRCRVEMVLVRNPVTDFSLKPPPPGPIFPWPREPSRVQEALGPWPGPWNVGLGGEGRLFLRPHRKFCSSLLPRGWSQQLCSVLSQHPRAFEDL